MSSSRQDSSEVSEVHVGGPFLTSRSPGPTVSFGLNASYRSEGASLSFRDLTVCLSTCALPTLEPFTILGADGGGLLQDLLSRPTGKGSALSQTRLLPTAGPPRMPGACATVPEQGNSMRMDPELPQDRAGRGWAGHVLAPHLLPQLELG
ncbi:hypothetical protein P7K49_032798 [Saguinus oedipus]|uniref:Uncharacterized protein n=1 Tax=Saguinus oedipus TaxID=9490 RepID=A0ABQ9TQ51_SAGOE|nr:hypothetical protein P7K49_032798 [Saguinus oedipus]